MSKKIILSTFIEIKLILHAANSYYILYHVFALIVLCSVIVYTPVDFRWEVGTQI